MNKIKTFFQSLHTPDPFFNISYFVMMLMMALLPITTFFMWPIGVTLMLLWLVQWNWREKWANFKANDGIPYGFFLLGVFLIPILGFINSTNMPVAWRTFECHLWFLVTPLVFLTTSPKLWSRKHIRVLLVLFCISEVLLLAFMFVRGLYRTASTGDINYMLNCYFCYKRHHAYVSLYATFAYILIFSYLIDNYHQLSKKCFWLYCLLESFIAVAIFCLYSRAGILTFLMMHTLWCGYTIYRHRSIWKYMVALMVFGVVLFTALIVVSPGNRFTEEACTLDNEEKEPDPRLFIWQASWSIAKENLPWGVGTGDGNDMILERYHANGNWDCDHPFNAHNQFLFALVTNGIPGLILILLYFYAPLGLAIKHRDILMLSIFLLMFFNCLVECMFDRRAGVDFFAIMIPLFMLRENIEEESPEHLPKEP